MSAGLEQLADQLRIELDGDIARLLPLVYDELKVLARRQRQKMPSARDTTSLVHDAYLKLANQQHIDWRSRRQFFYLAAVVMRHLLVDEMRRDTVRRDNREEVKRRQGTHTNMPADLLALDAALNRLVNEAPRLVDVVNCRFFGGFSIAETADVLEISPATVKRDWALARAWLYQNLQGS